MVRYRYNKLCDSLAKRLVVLFAFLFLGSYCIAQDARPVITKIDPPNWFAQLPDSLLLIYGRHLEGAAFTLRNTTARVAEANTSPNGHWAFLVLSATGVKPGTFEIVASNTKGSASVPYTLAALRPASSQPRGFDAHDVMYLIMPDRFADGDIRNDRVAGFRDPDDRSRARAYHGGDLRGIEEHLNYLQQMGVTTIWTTPLYDNSASQSGQTYHGYSASDMYAVDPHFGTMADYQALVKAAHARGMKVVLDTVPNHVGPDHPWAKDPPTPDWLHGTEASHLRVDSNDFGSITDPSANPERRRIQLDGWFDGILPDLNQDNPLVQTYLVQNAIWWIESAGLDGLRLDTFPFVPRRFWHDYNGLLHSQYPNISEIGEIFDRDPRVTSFFAGGRANQGSDGTYDTQLDTTFDYPLFFAMRSALTHHAAMKTIADVFAEDNMYLHPERLVTFIGNHDNKRFLSEPGANVAALRLAYGLLATLRGMPQLYYGDEIGLTGGDDPDNRKDFPGGFAKDKENSFSDSGRTADQNELHDWVKTVMLLRQQTPALQTGVQQILFADDDTLAFTRGPEGSHTCLTSPGEERYIVVVNNNSVTKNVQIPLQTSSAEGCTHFSSLLQSDVAATLSGGTMHITLQGEKIVVFRARP
jgi:neopullulanase